MPNRNLFYFFLLFALISCHQEINPACEKYAHENYQYEKVDSSLYREALDDHQRLLSYFDETSIEDSDHEAYLLLFYSSFDYGKSVKFEKRVDSYSMKVKCILKDDFYTECKEQEIQITEEEWLELERMIYEFNFWTSKQLNEPREVLDGFVYFLEGNRPNAKNCNKKDFYLTGRASPRYDKLGALCNYISRYEQELSFQYNQENW